MMHLIEMTHVCKSKGLFFIAVLDRSKTFFPLSFKVEYI